MQKTMTYEYAAKEFLKQYAKENNIKDICELFNKYTLVEFVYQSDWDWSVKDEMQHNGLSAEEAERETERWFLGMSKQVLFYERMSDSDRNWLITDKAEDLGFEWEDE